MWPTGAMSDRYVMVSHAEKLWFHGRTKQLLTRAWCWIVGHEFSYPWRDLFEYEDEWTPPKPNDVVQWFRRCDRQCGTLQSGWASKIELDRGALDVGDDFRHRFGRRVDSSGMAPRTTQLDENP